MPERVFAEQYATLEQQQDAATLGMWVFLSTEVLFFGGLLLGYAAYRHAYPQAFADVASIGERVASPIVTTGRSR